MFTKSWNGGAVNGEIIFPFPDPVNGCSFRKVISCCNLLYLNLSNYCKVLSDSGSDAAKIASIRKAIRQNVPRKSKLQWISANYLCRIVFGGKNRWVNLHKYTNEYRLNKGFDIINFTNIDMLEERSYLGSYSRSTESDARPGEQPCSGRKHTHIWCGIGAKHDPEPLDSLPTGDFRGAGAPARKEIGSFADARQWFEGRRTKLLQESLCWYHLESNPSPALGDDSQDTSTCIIIFQNYFNYCEYNQSIKKW